MDDFEGLLTACWVLQNQAAGEWAVLEVREQRQGSGAAEAVVGQLVVPLETRVWRQVAGPAAGTVVGPLVVLTRLKAVP